MRVTKSSLSMFACVFDFLLKYFLYIKTTKEQRGKPNSSHAWNCSSAALKAFHVMWENGKDTFSKDGCFHCRILANRTDYFVR